jgi:hypothetical protein
LDIQESLKSYRYLAADEYGLVVLEAQVGRTTVIFEDLVTRKTIHFWMEPIAQLLEVSVSTYAQENKIEDGWGSWRRPCWARKVQMSNQDHSTRQLREAGG